MGPTWVLSAPDWPHEPCYKGSALIQFAHIIFTTGEKVCVHPSGAEARTFCNHVYNVGGDALAPDATRSSSARVWLYTKRLLSSFKNDFYRPFLVWRNGRKCKHIFFPENNLAFKWLIFTVGQMTCFTDNHQLVLSSSGRTNLWFLIMLLIGVIS